MDQAGFLRLFLLHPQRSPVLHSFCTSENQIAVAGGATLAQSVRQCRREMSCRACRRSRQSGRFPVVLEGELPGGSKDAFRRVAGTWAFAASSQSPSHRAGLGRLLPPSLRDSILGSMIPRTNDPAECVRHPRAKRPKGGWPLGRIFLSGGAQQSARSFEHTAIRGSAWGWAVTVFVADSLFIRL